jgi:glycosyltransferase involved in cell wall biosynthesis
VRILFYKEELTWPRTSGHDVHAYYMMRGLQREGHEIGLLTRRAPLADATSGIDYAFVSTLDPLILGDREALPRPLTSMQRRFCSYWGTEPEDILRVRVAARAMSADVLVAVGLEALPYLAAWPEGRRVWYAADEWFLHHMSLLKFSEPATWVEIRQGVIKLLYERAYRTYVDRAWVVAEGDARTMHRLAGMRKVDILPNGVDLDHYQLRSSEPDPRSCVFWGRLDFEPNLQGLYWFTEQIWPSVRRLVADASLRIYGFNPTADALALARLPGVSVHPNVHDLRPEVVRSTVAVLPFVTGGGIKNKILEAAALGMPILCTRRACGGLRGSAFPFVVSDEPAEWALALDALWRDGGRTQDLGLSARDWVVRNHSWEATAREASRVLSAD